MIAEASVDAVVIGCGSLGASTAFHLVARGLSVAIVDRHGPANQTSPRAAGLAVQIYADEDLTRISMRSAAKLRRFGQDTGEPLEVHVTGSIKLARTEGDADQVAREIARGRAVGVDVESIEPAQARALAPWLDPAEAVAMWFAPDDLYLEPGDLPRAYARAAIREGARAYWGEEVKSIAGSAGEVVVATEATRIVAGAAVVAAGAWAPSLVSRLGVRLPVAAARHMLLITEPLPTVSPSDPCVRIIDAHSYTRPEQGGLMFGAYEPTPTIVPVGGEPRDIGELELDPLPLRGVIDRLRGTLPVLADAKVRLLRGGLPMMSPDGGWIVDRLPTPGAVYVATADNVAGLGPSPALGEDLAAWIALGERPPTLDAFGLGRFAGLSEAEVERAAEVAYAARYRS